MFLFLGMVFPFFRTKVFRFWESNSHFQNKSVPFLGIKFPFSEQKCSVFGNYNSHFQNKSVPIFGKRIPKVRTILFPFWDIKVTLDRTIHGIPYISSFGKVECVKTTRMSCPKSDMCKDRSDILP